MFKIKLDMEPEPFTLWEIIFILVYMIAILIFATWVYTPIGYFDSFFHFIKYYFDR